MDTEKRKRSPWIYLPGVLLVAAASCAALVVFALHNAEKAVLPEGITSAQQESLTQPGETERVNSVVRDTSSVPAETSSSAATAAQTTAGATHTGFTPLPELPLMEEKPDKIPNLPTKRIDYSYGVASGGKPHQISVDAQKFFDGRGYKALALDTKSEDKRLYLTFDIGYENGVTAGILDTLKAKKVPAAFFATLHHIKTNPELAARMITEGHIIGNHSVSHPDFSKLSREEMIQEIQGFDNYLRANFGYTAPYFRFPEGAYSENALHLAQALGYTSVFWSVSWADWDTSKQQGSQFAFDTVTSRLHPGAVIMLHAVSKDNAGAMGDIIDWAREQGYEFRALSDYR